MSDLKDLVDGGLDLGHELAPNIGFTSEWLLKGLIANDQEFVEDVRANKVSNIKSENITANGGYCSYVYRVSVEFGNSSSARTYVMKVPTIGRLRGFYDYADGKDVDEIMLQYIHRSHNVECEAYKLLRGLEDFPKPHVYFLQKYEQDQHGVLVMEDLNRRAVPMEMHLGASEALCYNFAKHIADFQAHVDLMPRKSWRGKYQQCFHVDPENINHTWKSMLRNTAGKLDQAPDLKTGFLRFVEMDLLAFNRYAYVELPAKYDALTLCHADIWENNMMLSRESTDEIAAIFDWQVLFEANPLFDIARFMACSPNAQVRRQIGSNIVDIYYARLSNNYGKHGKQPKFSRETAHHLYQVVSLLQCAILAIRLGLRAFPLRESGNAGDLEKFQGLYQKIHSFVEDAMIVERELQILEKFPMKS